MDYSITHADYDKHHQREDDFAEWFDSLPDPQPITPTCGQCKHFETRGSSLDAPNIGVCKLRKQREWTSATTWITTLEPREQFDPICDRYVEECPF
jgi:hypothetical protein